MSMRLLILSVGLFALAACSTAPKQSKIPPPVQTVPEPVVQTPPPVQQPMPAPAPSPYPPAQEDPNKRGDYVAGGVYAPHIKDSAPDALPDVDRIPEPEVKPERPSRHGNRTYSVLGKSYRVLSTAEGYVERGMASFYGKKFHGRLTSNQEVYDMYAMTAAHKTLPLPSFVRVTNLENGKSIVVRVNDRGPFHAGRIIDLSYAAAAKLGFVNKGVAQVEVRALNASEQRKARGKKAQIEPDIERPLRREAIASVEQVKPLPQLQGTQTTQIGNGVSIQLASFATRNNAERAQARLRTGGIDGARIDEAKVNGQLVWRLRIGPISDGDAQALSVRLVALGFETPRIVRE